MENKQAILLKAHEIATSELRRCYKDGKILASLKNFSDFWARDTFWAIAGVLEIGDYAVAKQSLEYFLSFQKSDGKIPRKIAVDFNAIKYLFGKSILRKKPKAIWTANLPPFSCMDVNALLVIAFADYVEKSGDVEFGKKYYKKVKKAVYWYRKHLQRGFIQEYGLSNWMDVIFKNGHVLYTNVVYAQALKKISEVAKIIGEGDSEKHFKKLYADFKERINAQFWNGSFFDDQLGNHRNFDVAGNTLACYFQIATEEKAKLILDKLRAIRKNKVLLPTVDPKYPWWKVNPVTYLLGMQNYQNGVSWMWIDLFAIGAMHQNGFNQEAQTYFAEICEIIVKNKAVHETYFNDGTIYKAKHWESAVPFAWGSGVFLDISHQIGADKLDTGQEEK